MSRTRANKTRTRGWGESLRYIVANTAICHGVIPLGTDVGGDSLLDSDRLVRLSLRARPMGKYVDIQWCVTVCSLAPTIPLFNFTDLHVFTFVAYPVPSFVLSLFFSDPPCRKPVLLFLFRGGLGWRRRMQRSRRSTPILRRGSVSVIARVSWRYSGCALDQSSAVSRCYIPFKTS